MTRAKADVGIRFLERALALAEAGAIANRGGPFGAVIVRDGRVIAEGCNEVTSRNDPTAHAEIMAIRAACRRLRRVHLDECVIYVNCEPCIMCLGAIYWAHLASVCYASTRAEAAASGFDDADIHAEVAKPPAERRVPVRRLRCSAARRPFETWLAKADRILY